MADKGRILVVDDDRLVLATVSHGLAQAGYTVIDADNGDDAILLDRDGRHPGEDDRAVGPVDHVALDTQRPVKANRAFTGGGRQLNLVFIEKANDVQRVG